MDIEKILKKYKNSLRKKIRDDSKEHISPENIIKFVYNEFDPDSQKNDKEYNKIIDHLSHCSLCAEEVKEIRNIMKNEKELFAIKDDAISNERARKIFKKIGKYIDSKENQEKAKKFAHKFISEHYPTLKSQFNLAWEAILKIPEGAKLVLSKKELPALGFTDSERKTDQLLLIKILFTIRNVFREIDENNDIDQFKIKIQNFSKQNKLSNKIKNKLIELIISDKKFPIS